MEVLANRVQEQRHTHQSGMGAGPRAAKMVQGKIVNLRSGCHRFGFSEKKKIGLLLLTSFFMCRVELQRVLAELERKETQKKTMVSRSMEAYLVKEDTREAYVIEGEAWSTLFQSNQDTSWIKTRVMLQSWEDFKDPMFGYGKPEATKC
jgi:hypothetical protein